MFSIIVTVLSAWKRPGYVTEQMDIVGLEALPTSKSKRSGIMALMPGLSVSLETNRNSSSHLTPAMVFQDDGAANADSLPYLVDIRLP